MSNWLNEAVSNPAVITLGGIVVVLLLAFLLRQIAKNYANTKVAVIMLGVEKKLSTWAKDQNANGAEKRKVAIKLVSTKVYPSLPSWMKVFITEEKLESMIDKLYGQMLDYLDDGVLNNSI